MLNFLLIDDHEAVRTGLKFLLHEKYPDAEIFEAANGELATEIIRTHPINVTVLDVQIPQTDTFSLMEYISIWAPKVSVLIYSMGGQNIYAKRFMGLGAKGFVPKSAPVSELLIAIDQILLGKIYVSTPEEIEANSSRTGMSDENPFDKLSRREFEIAKMLLSGESLTNISKNLMLQTSTVGTHKQRMFDKLHVTNLLELKELAKAYNFI